MKKKDAEKWVNALRGGKYKQGRDWLHSFYDNSFCCLGVLDEIFPELDLSGGHSGVLYNYSEIGFNSENGKIGDTSLDSLNDSGNFTFDEIADIIQAEYILKVVE